MVLGYIDLDEKWSLEVRPYYHDKQKSPLFLNVSYHSRPRAIAHVAKVIVASCVKCSQCETATLLGIIVRARRPRLGDCQSCECSISASFPTASNRVLGVCSALADD